MDQRQLLLSRIREMGLERGLKTDRAISMRAALGPKAVADLEEAVTGPGLATLLAICEAVGAYSIDELLGPSASTSFYALQRGAESHPSMSA